MTKALIPTENSKSKVTIQTRHQNVDYTTIVDRLRNIKNENLTHTNVKKKSRNSYKDTCGSTILQLIHNS